jgi:bifunctional DNase/RNase
MAEERNYVEMKVVGVGQDQGNKALVLLQDAHERQLPIWIGHCEAIAIVQRLSEEFDPPRPLTQDLAVNLWKRLGGTLRQLRIDDLWQLVYYSKLSVEQDGRLVDIDCRPSDGIAIALAAGVPIYVAEHVLEQTETDEEPEN